MQEFQSKVQQVATAIIVLSSHYKQFLMIIHHLLADTR